MKPASVLILILILVPGILSCGCTSPSPAMKTVRVAYLPTSDYAPLHIANEEGFFTEQGIGVEFVKVQSSAAALPLVLNGDIGVYAGPMKIGLVNAITKGEHVRIVADKGRVARGCCTAYALMVRKDLSDSGTVTNVSDLRGRKIAERDSDYDLYHALALGNLSADDVDTIDMAFPMVIPAFANGAIDAGLVTEPYLTEAVNNGTAVILAPAEDFIPDYPFILFYGPAILDKDPELGRRFMVAYLKGVRQYNEGKTERNLRIIGNYTGLDRDLLNRTCWFPIREDGYVPREPVRDYMDWMYDHKKISRNLDDDQLFDMSYAEYANGVLNGTGRTPGKQ
jgi:NitT/TauT family transport system substrate-binding protein